jgi:hypothetical protein
VVGQCRAANPGKRILLIADQFEEVFTLVADEALRNRFIDALIAAFPDPVANAVPDVCLVLTLRADFYNAALRYRPLADRLQDHIENLGPMNRDELREAIVKPAEAVGVGFEPGLVNTILDDVQRRPGSLPLLQFALREMWGRLKTPRMTRADYDAIGGVEGALAKRAQAIFDNATQEGKDEPQVALFCRLFTRLVTLGEGAEDTRRIVGRDELGPDAWALSQKLADEHNRLVVTAAPAPGQETVEVVHEALIRQWPTLVTWIIRDRSFQLWLRQLKQRIDEWKVHPEDDGTLLRGSPLAVAEEWLSRRGKEFSGIEKEYVTRSVQLRDLEQRRAIEVRELELNRKVELAEAARQISDERSARAEAEKELAQKERARSQIEKERAEASLQLVAEKERRKFTRRLVTFVILAVVCVSFFSILAYRGSKQSNYSISYIKTSDASAFSKLSAHFFEHGDYKTALRLALIPFEHEKFDDIGSMGKDYAYLNDSEIALYRAINANTRPAKYDGAFPIGMFVEEPLDRIDIPSNQGKHIAIITMCNSGDLSVTYEDDTQTVVSLPPSVRAQFKLNTGSFPDAKKDELEFKSDCTNDEDIWRLFGRKQAKDYNKCQKGSLRKSEIVEEYRQQRDIRFGEITCAGYYDDTTLIADTIGNLIISNGHLGQNTHVQTGGGEIVYIDNTRSSNEFSSSKLLVEKGQEKSTILTASIDRVIRLWDPTGVGLGVLIGGNGVATASTILGDIVAVGSDQNQITFWNTRPWGIRMVQDARGIKMNYSYPEETDVIGIY